MEVEPINSFASDILEAELVDFEFFQTMENPKSHSGRTATKKCQQVLYGLHQEMLNLHDQVCEPCFFLRCLEGFPEKVGIACWGEQPVRPPQ